MSEKSSLRKFVEYINSHILPFIDYGELQKSYDTDMEYAKGILHRLHNAMIKTYGDEHLDYMSGEEGFVMIPAVVRGIESEKMCIALVDLDLHSSGEHWGTSFLCKYGVIDQSGEFIKNNSILKAETAEINAMYLPYDYCYTASIPCDIHIDENRLPKKIKEVLRDFRNYRVTLQHEQEEKPSVIEKIRKGDGEKSASQKPKTPKNKKKTEPEL